MRKSAVLFVVVACLLLATSVVAADAMNVVRGGIGYVKPSGDTTGVGGGYTLEAQSAMNLYIAYERKINDLFGVNFDLFVSNHDIDVTGNGLNDNFADMRMMPLTVAGLFHPLEKGKVDFYIGPAFSWVMYDDPTIERKYSFVLGNQPGLNVSDDFTWAFQTGADFMFNETWGLNLDFKYIATQAEDLDINPMVFGVGFAAHF